ncbi:MAG TPA: FAD binding domain-containing protein [Candidatus Binataceae bacterium]|nr:FAD binding domain-containing protein [Candidatus Binataceae bacterium]
MNRFEIVAPVDLAHATRLLGRENTMAIAGGVDLLDLLKLDVASPTTLVNLKGLKELDGIDVKPDGSLRIGALAKIGTIADHPEIIERFTAIAEAAENAATPQIRNLATAAGNLTQRPRCWYFRNPDTLCLRKGGKICFSIAGLNRYHAILGGGPSFIVHPSNLAPALIAYRASVHIVGPGSERTVDLEKFFTLPTVDSRRENVLVPGEIITAILVPKPPDNARSSYLEVREKQSFDWPLVSAAAMVATVGPNSKEVRDARVVMGAVAPIPWRSTPAEDVIKNRPLNIARARDAAEAALKGAIPMSDNAYKVRIAKAVVRRAILKSAGIEEVA